MTVPGEFVWDSRKSGTEFPYRSFLRGRPLDSLYISLK